MFLNFFLIFNERTLFEGIKIYGRFSNDFKVENSKISTKIKTLTHS